MIVLIGISAGVVTLVQTRPDLKTAQTWADNLCKPGGAFSECQMWQDGRRIGTVRTVERRRGRG